MGLSHLSPVPALDFCRASGSFSIPLSSPIVCLLTLSCFPCRKQRRCLCRDSNRGFHQTEASRSSVQPLGRSTCVDGWGFRSKIPPEMKHYFSRTSKFFQRENPTARYSSAILHTDQLSEIAHDGCKCSRVLAIQRDHSCPIWSCTKKVAADLKVRLLRKNSRNL